MSDEIVINYLSKDSEVFKVIPLDNKRNWMRESKKGFAYKCIPLTIANRYGWTVLSPADFSVSWYGGKDRQDVEVFSTDKHFLENSVVTHFGEQTFTLQLDFVIRTPENYSIYVRGVPNKDYGIIKPLDAIIETDWLPFTFTYNFKFSSEGIIDFKKGEPLFSFFPIKRNSIENFDIKKQWIQDDQDFFNDFLEYGKSRQEFMTNPRFKMKTQDFYLDGKGPNKKYFIPNHIKRIFFKDVE